MAINFPVGSEVNELLVRDVFLKMGCFKKVIIIS